MLSWRSSAFALACSQSASGTRTERMTIGIFATRGSVLGVLTLWAQEAAAARPRSVTEPNRRDGSEWPAPSADDRRCRTSRRQSEHGHDYARVPRQYPVAFDSHKGMPSPQPTARTRSPTAIDSPRRSRSEHNSPAGLVAGCACPSMRPLLHIVHTFVNTFVYTLIAKRTPRTVTVQRREPDEGAIYTAAGSS